MSHKWYTEHILIEQYPIYILTLNDQDKALYNSLTSNCLTLSEFISQFSESFPLIFQLGTQLIKEPESLQQQIFDEYLDSEEIENGIKIGKYFRGRIVVSKLDNTEATVRLRTIDVQIYIKGLKNMNRAIHLDFVYIQILPESEWISQREIASLNPLENDDLPEKIIIEDISEIKEKTILEKISSSKKIPAGKVVGIYKRNERTYAGSIDMNKILSKNKINLCIFVPYDSRIPRINMKTSDADLFNKKRILVRIDKWDSIDNYPNGHCIRVIGENGDPYTEAEVIFHEHNIEYRSFSSKVMSNLPPEDWQIPSEELERRADFRNYCVCSIDPVGCKDIDDALHCRILPNGNFEVGVHIADVTYFVKPESDIDNEAARRSTTVYLIDRRSDMYPKVLTEILCSLVSNQDRLAFSVVWEFDSNTFDIKSVKYCKAVINSKASLCYEDAQKIIDGKMKDPYDPIGETLTKSLRNLMKISKHLKKLRNNKGALTLSSTEVKFSLDLETHNPTDVSIYKLFDANSMVEEFMLLANIAVAEKIASHYPSYSILRRHPNPKENELKILGEFVKKNVNIDFNTLNSKLLSESLDKCEKKDNPFFNKLIRVLTTRTMNQAVYFCSSEYDYKDFYHYGLAVEIYTHFTSPIRRYADDLVHRLLAAAIDFESLPKSMTNLQNVIRQCDIMNSRHRQAQFASRASSEFHSYLFFSKKDLKTRSRISHISDKGIFALSPKYGIEAELDFAGLQIEINSKTKEYTVNGTILSLFDKIEVQILAIDLISKYSIKYRFLRKLKEEESEQE